MALSIVEGLLFCLSALQAVLYLWMARKIFTYRPVKGALTAPVSVVVAAHQEAHHLPALLKALGAQHYPHFEVIVVNDRSTDGSKELLDEAATRFPWLRVLHVAEVPEGINPKKYALLQGIGAAAHDLLLLTDADCVPRSEGWVMAMAQGFRPGIEVVLGVGLYATRKGLLNLLIRYETLYTALLYTSCALAGRPYMGVGRNLAYRKGYFLEKNGFEGFLHVKGGDDDLLVQKLATPHNVTVVLQPMAHTISSPKDTWKGWFYQKIRHLQAGLLYQQTDFIFLGLIQAGHIGFYVFLVMQLAAGNILVAAIVYSIRFFVVYLMIGLAVKKLKAQIDLVRWVTLTDILYLAYCVTLGAVSMFYKRNSW